MNSNTSLLPVKWGTLICMLAGIYAVAVSAYILIETGKASGSRDYYPFWYAGHFVLQGDDPYAAYLAGEQPQLPIHYLDGVTVTKYPLTQSNLSAIPSNTPIMLLLLSPLSYFSWGVAKWLFVAVNLALMVITGQLVIRHVPFAGIRLARVDELFLFLMYFDLSATRIAIENGQTTLIVFLMMLLALTYARRSWPVAGAALGIALSKYSLSLPMFVFLLYKRNFKVLLAAVVVQVAGLLGLAAMSGSSPVLIVQENLRLFAEIFGQPGIHLSHFFEQFIDNRLLTQVPVLVMTLLVFVPLLLWLRRDAFGTAEDVIDLHVVSILFIWTMLIGYHRLYDTLILMVFVVLLYKGLAYPNVWGLDRSGRLLLLGFIAISPLILILPARLVDKVLADYYGTVSDGVTTIFLLMMLGISMFLLRSFLHNLQTETTSERMESHDLPLDQFRETRQGWADHA